ncbi:hypothetical protein ACFO4O_16345 [Glaciecola siphonariae]|uniref:Uncharacterized protein n=1 Tax=Glaciecola siphonariae TaxID=521012 RepID=A0ABV9LYR4_9ALTE
MSDHFEYILSQLKISEDDEWGLCIELIDYEHFDYIDDVITEIFDIEYSFCVMDESEGKFIMYFKDDVTKCLLVDAVSKINRHHKFEKKEYVLPSST